ncbi:MAG TPA: Gfo/Idh/MocA family oxidoreductase [Clostridia bacterium]|nr:Gfo/Idh/MocA family oxidoreductase [Clostridia bacterium]
MKDGKVGICLVGAGRAGMIHAVNFKSRVPNAEMVAVADPFEQACITACKELSISKYYLDYKQALEDKDIDAFIVVAPTAYHKGIVVDAARAGKHILCEKPMAMDEYECDEMIKVTNENKVKLQIGFMRRFDESFMQAKEVVESGEIGDVVMVRSNTRGPSVPQKWMYDITKSNGPLAEVNSHDIDTLRWFTKSEFKSVYAIGGNYRSPEALPDFPDFYDNVTMNAQFENGVQGIIDGAQGVAYGYDARVEILGTKGIIFLGQVHEKSIAVCTKEKGITRPIMNSWRYLFREAYLEEDRHFVDCILNDLTPKVTGTDGKMAVKVVKAGNKSIVEKKIVEL